jgi:hypothetical protein
MDEGQACLSRHLLVTTRLGMIENWDSNQVKREYGEEAREGERERERERERKLLIDFRW